MNRIHGPSFSDEFYQIEETLSCHGSGLGSAPRPIMISMLLNGQPLEIELDTGATLSLISDRDFKRLFREKSLCKSYLVLRTYTDELLKPLGSVTVMAQYKCQVAEMELYVVPEGGVPLLG